MIIQCKRNVNQIWFVSKRWTNRSYIYTSSLSYSFPIFIHILRFYDYRTTIFIIQRIKSQIGVFIPDNFFGANWCRKSNLLNKYYFLIAWRYQFSWVFNCKKNESLFQPKWRDFFRKDAKRKSFKIQTWCESNPVFSAYLLELGEGKNKIHIMFLQFAMVKYPQNA